MPLKSYFTKEAPVSNCQGPSLMSLSSAPPAPCSSPWLQNSLSPPVLLLSTFRATTHRLSWSLLSLSASFQLKSAAELSHLPKQMPHIFTESNAGTIPHSSPHRGREGEGVVFQLHSSICKTLERCLPREYSLPSSTTNVH